MKKDIKEYTFDFLNLFLNGMEKEGVNHNIFRTDINEDFVSDLNSRIKDQLSLHDAEKIADVCLANEWLKHTVMGGGKYFQLRLTTSGVGVVISKKRQFEILQKRAIPKILSDYINDHSGIFVLLSFLVSILSLVVAIMAIIFSLKKGK